MGNKPITEKERILKQIDNFLLSSNIFSDKESIDNLKQLISKSLTDFAKSVVPEEKEKHKHYMGVDCCDDCTWNYCIQQMRKNIK